MGLPVKSNAEGVVTLADAGRCSPYLLAIPPPSAISMVGRPWPLRCLNVQPGQCHQVCRLGQGSGRRFCRYSCPGESRSTIFLTRLILPPNGRVAGQHSHRRCPGYGSSGNALGLRSGLLVSLGIPFSLFGATIVVYLLGYSFNFMVIFGLLLALGMLIDGGHCGGGVCRSETSRGRMLRDAYVTAVRRMFMPVVASTATTLAVFLPLMLCRGWWGIHVLPASDGFCCAQLVSFTFCYLCRTGCVVWPKKDQSAPATDIPVRARLIW